MNDQPNWYGSGLGQLSAIARDAHFETKRPYAGQSKKVYRMKDLAKFLKDGMQWGKRRDIFQTTRSIGFASGNYREGDQVFAIDGAKAPFILRNIEENRYKIVSDCYLWGAMDLVCEIYHTPGGQRSRPNVETREHRTRVIELL